MKEISAASPPMKPCRLCLRTSKLRRSHIIPNALFRQIKHRNEGKAIVFDDTPQSRVEYTSGSWWEYLLCESCEARIGLIDKYALELLRNARKAGTPRGDGAIFEHLNYGFLKHFVVSILWRASISSLPQFEKVRLRNHYAEALRHSLLSEAPLQEKSLPCRIQLLYDPTPGGFSDDSLAQLIASPVARFRASRASYVFVLDGYVIELFVPDAPLREWSRPGMLRENDRLYVPARNIFDIPEVVHLLLTAYGKHERGRVSAPIKQRS